MCYTEVGANEISETVCLRADICQNIFCLAFIKLKKLEIFLYYLPFALIYYPPFALGKSREECKDI